MQGFVLGVLCGVVSTSAIVFTTLNWKKRKRIAEDDGGEFYMDVFVTYKVQDKHKQLYAGNSYTIMGIGISYGEIHKRIIELGLKRVKEHVPRIEYDEASLSMIITNIQTKFMYGIVNPATGVFKSIHRPDGCHQL